jgi:hypothetical protein
VRNSTKGGEIESLIYRLDFLSVSPKVNLGGLNQINTTLSAPSVYKRTLIYTPAVSLINAPVKYINQLFWILYIVNTVTIYACAKIKPCESGCNRIDQHNIKALSALHIKFV